MSHLNKVIVSGNLTRDPQMRLAGASNTPVSDLRLAINRTWKSAKGEKHEDVCFIDVVVWGRSAESAVQYLKKGRLVLVEGRLELNEWTNQQGEKVSRIRIVSDRIFFMPQGDRGAHDPPAAAGGSSAEESMEDAPAAIPA